MTNILILLLVAPLLYLVLGMVTGVLLTLLQTDHLKLKIVLLTFLRPVAYTFILSLLLPALFDHTWLLLAGFALAVVLRDIIFSNHKFLLNLTARGSSISIQYINSFLQTKHIDFSQDLNSKLQLSEMKTIANYPASLKVGEGDGLQQFIILTKETWDRANARLHAANIEMDERLAGQTNIR